MSFLSDIDITNHGKVLADPCEELKERLRILEGWIRWERGEGPRGYLEKYKKIKS